MITPSTFMTKFRFILKNIGNENTKQLGRTLLLGKNQRWSSSFYQTVQVFLARWRFAIVDRAIIHFLQILLQMFDILVIHH